MAISNQYLLSFCSQLLSVGECFHKFHTCKIHEEFDCNTCTACVSSRSHTIVEKAIPVGSFLGMSEFLHFRWFRWRYQEAPLLSTEGIVFGHTPFFRWFSLCRHCPSGPVFDGRCPVDPKKKKATLLQLLEVFVWPDLPFYLFIKTYF